MKGIAFAFMSAFLLLACSTKELSPLEKRMAAKMSFMKVDSKIVKGFNYRTNMNGLLEFELVLLSDEDLELEYKVSWLDEDGFVLKGQKDGEFIRIKLNENKEYLLQRVAINKDAADFTLLLRKK
ncbi:DUF1425 domain-containing protein [Campylobacter troglodytis]|uniref:DUF1425 domain-containing protein n=1 Tax=Campylobacter troglodytis TaxID=654363 RepID=UPI00115A612B|nr:DUF1425 domain-containing protein [Campylobacter troglodytis]TQR54340.1 hypothetical protein DMC01_10350 [Campylobacter troglodytis]